MGKEVRGKGRETRGKERESGGFSPRTLAEMTPMASL